MRILFDLHGLRDKPRVTVALNPAFEDCVRIAYGTTNLWFRSPEIEYYLPFEPAFQTFRRFLNHLWTETVAEPIPEDLRSPVAPFSAPILTFSKD